MLAVNQSMIRRLHGDQEHTSPSELEIVQQSDDEYLASIQHEMYESGRE
jgi:hypothetical protein